MKVSLPRLLLLVLAAVTSLCTTISLRGPPMVVIVAEATQQIFHGTDSKVSLEITIQKTDTLISVNNITLGDNADLAIVTTHAVYSAGLQIIVKNCNLGRDLVLKSRSTGGGTSSTTFITTSIQMINNSVGGQMYLGINHEYLDRSRIKFDRGSHIFVANNRVTRWFYFGRAYPMQISTAPTTTEMTLEIAGRSRVELQNNTIQTMYIGTGISQGKCNLTLSGGSTLVVSGNQPLNAMYIGRATQQGESILNVLHGSHISVSKNRIGNNMYFGFARSPSKSRIISSCSRSSISSVPSGGASQTGSITPLSGGGITFSENIVTTSFFLGYVYGPISEAVSGVSEIAFSSGCALQIDKNRISKKLRLGYVINAGQSLLSFSNNASVLVNENRIDGSVVLFDAHGTPQVMAASTNRFLSGSALTINRNAVGSTTTTTGAPRSEEETITFSELTIGDSNAGVTSISFSDGSTLQIFDNQMPYTDLLLGSARGDGTGPNGGMGQTTLTVSSSSSLRINGNTFFASMFGTSWFNTGSVRLSFEGPGTIAFENNLPKDGYYYCSSFGIDDDQDDPVGLAGKCILDVTGCWLISMKPITPWKPSYPSGFAAAVAACLSSSSPPSSIPPTPLPTALTPVTTSNVPAVTSSQASSFSTAVQTPLTTTSPPQTPMPSTDRDVTRTIAAVVEPGSRSGEEESNNLASPLGSQSSTTGSTTTAARSSKLGVESSSSVQEEGSGRKPPPIAPSSSKLSSSWDSPPNHHHSLSSPSDQTTMMFSSQTGGGGSSLDNNNIKDGENDQLAAANAASVGESGTMTGLVIGLIVAVVIVGVIVTTLAFLYIRRKGSKKRDSSRAVVAGDFDDLELSDPGDKTSASEAPQRPAAGSIADRYRRTTTEEDGSRAISSSPREEDDDDDQSHDTNNRNQVNIVPDTDSNGGAAAAAASTLGPRDLQLLRRQQQERQEQRNALNQLRQQAGQDPSTEDEVNNNSGGGTLGPQAIRRFREERRQRSSEQTIESAVAPAGSSNEEAVNNESGEANGSVSTLGPQAVRQFRQQHEQQEQQERSRQRSTEAAENNCEDEQQQETDIVDDAEPSTLRSEQIRRFRVRY